MFPLEFLKFRHSESKTMAQFKCVGVTKDCHIPKNEIKRRRFNSDDSEITKAPKDIWHQFMKQYSLAMESTVK